jgi:hypothetical protein
MLCNAGASSILLLTCRRVLYSFEEAVVLELDSWLILNDQRILSNNILNKFSMIAFASFEFLNLSHLVLELPILIQYFFFQFFVFFLEH